MPGERWTSILERQGCLSYLLGVKNTVLVSLRLFNFKRPTAGVFAGPFRALNRKIKDDRRLCVVLELVSLRNEKTSSHAHKTGSWYLLEVLSDEHPCSFYMRVPSGGVC